MSTTTTNLNMVLNEGQDKFSIPTLNENLTKIDTAIGEQNKKIVQTFSNECRLMRHGRIRVLQLKGILYETLSSIQLNTEDRPSDDLFFSGFASVYPSQITIDTQGYIKATLREIYGGDSSYAGNTHPMYGTLAWIV